MDALNFKFKKQTSTKSFRDFSAGITQSVSAIQSAKGSGKGKDCNYGKEIYCLTCGSSAIKKAFDIVKKEKPLPEGDVFHLINEMTKGCNKITYSLPNITTHKKSSKRRENCNNYISRKKDNMMKWIDPTLNSSGGSGDNLNYDGSSGTGGGTDYSGDSSGGYDGNIGTNDGMTKTAQAGMSPIMWVLIVGLIVTMAVAFMRRRSAVPVAK